MKTLPDESVDSVVTDPPYELGFMGKGWDSSGIAYNVEVWRESLRVLKPGGHLLAFSGTRTYHRMACAIEDAGFEIRDQIGWLYGSGFPKSRNIAEQDMSGEDSAQWAGWGTALKPAQEPICVARKPLDGTVAGNVLEHGTGALNIDACRVPAEAMRPNTGSGGLPRRHEDECRGRGTVTQPHSLGRWPANIIHDGSEEVLEAFAQYGERGASAPVKGTEASAASTGLITGERARVAGAFHGDTGTAARFFYSAKASRADRNEGCDGIQDREGGMNSNTSGQHITRRDGWKPAPVKNNHPTVKPTSLMRYLCRLVTPPGGTVLDIFTGSGSTGKAAVLEGFEFIGFDLDSDDQGRPLGYLDIARARIEYAYLQRSLLDAEGQPQPQLDLFSNEYQKDGPASVAADPGRFIEIS
ncbi:DNA-methyltransferase [Pusillimonas noertemannii]|uniref:DNA-methyltransferase n=1 Tax=Pusillimonas noertemannii TaxID=305977 RepID=UPI001A9C3FCD|nr:site-specific DNA-methyltransferase [Pusillimonas noertemannii]